jgi:HEPN domain-containing protein
MADMADSNVPQTWIQKADEDFKFAEYTLEETEYYSHACFHFQQAAEKYLKAFIVAKEIPFQKIHSIITLLNICKESGYSFGPLLDAAGFLDGCYIDTRYPVHWPSGYTKEKALKARESAGQVRAAVKAALGLGNTDN